MKATFYAQFEKKARGVSLVGASNKAPNRPNGVVVKVSLNIPDGAFEPLEAEGDIEAGFVGIPIEVAPEELKEYLRSQAEKEHK